eukprot:TRINITY_DN13552_c1_g2_i2.p1 TRINITY_DN13552_c1_g2~~TRINITY_DN13552_c1_g2_i2.p1  ORF type:complete len:155 (-),score=31.91 TRINITY_DN13552_c1_g2_i2:176-640(-)
MPLREIDDLDSGAKSPEEVARKFRTRHFHFLRGVDMKQLTRLVDKIRAGRKGETYTATGGAVWDGSRHGIQSESRLNSSSFEYGNKKEDQPQEEEEEEEEYGGFFGGSTKGILAAQQAKLEAELEEGRDERVKKHQKKELEGVYERGDCEVMDL